MKKSILALFLTLGLVSAVNAATDSVNVIVTTTNKAPAKVLKSQSNGLIITGIASNGNSAYFDLKTTATSRILDNAWITVGSDADHFCDLSFIYWNRNFPDTGYNNAEIWFNPLHGSKCYGGWTLQQTFGDRNNTIHVVINSSN